LKTDEKTGSSIRHKKKGIRDRGLGEKKAMRSSRAKRDKYIKKKRMSIGRRCPPIRGKNSVLRQDGGVVTGKVQGNCKRGTE